MAGFRIVFLSLVPLISLCFVGNFLVQDVTLNDTPEEQKLTIEGMLIIFSCLDVSLEK